MEQLVVTEEGSLDVKNEQTHPLVKGLAVFFSYLFHPLFVIGWVTSTMTPFFWLLHYFGFLR